MRILYAGDSPVGGPANYLLGILRSLKADFVHVPPGKTLKENLLKRRFDALIFSDYPRRNVPAASERRIIEQVKAGSGLLMVGGWGSFSSGGWRGSLIEEFLPVTCLNRDDRVNLPGGAWIVEKRKHAMFRGMSFKNPPVICGLNRVRPRKGARVILTAREIRRRKEFPLLIADSARRIACLTTDLAPHWCGGLVDWGSYRKKLRVTKEIWIEVGQAYVRFVSSLLRWVAGFERFSYAESLRIFDALYQEAVALGFKKRRFSLKDLEADIRLARALNALGTAERKARRKKH